ncbi:MAG: hypothetical protein ABH864_07290 [archaeon]
MAEREWASVFVAILLMFIVAGLPSIAGGQLLFMTQVFVSSFVIVGGAVLMRKAFAHSLDIGVEHRIWSFYRFGVKPGWHFPKALPFGVIVPLFFAFLGLLARLPIMIFTFLTYETKALKHRAAKRFGFYSYTEITDWHNALVGASAIVFALIISLIGYFLNFEVLAKMAAYYAVWNMVPFSDLDGTQIFFGNKVLWIVLAITTVIFALYASVI